MRGPVPAAIATIIACAAPVAAQQLPSSADPSRVEQRLQPPRAPEALPDVAVPAPDLAPPPERAAEIRIGLREVVLEGATIYDKAGMEPLWRDLLREDATLADAYALRDRLAARYRADGYVLAQVVIPPQYIRQGVVTLRVSEGHVDEVKLEGAEGALAERLGALFAPVAAERPLRLATLERAVLLADELGGVAVRTILRPGTETGASQLLVLAEPTGIDWALAADNRGTSAIGRVQMDASLVAGNLFGDLGETSLRTVLTPQVEELRYLEAAHRTPLPGGSALVLEGRRTWSEPGDAVRDFGIDSDNLTVRTALVHPLLRTRAESLLAELTGTLRDGDTRSLGTDLSSDRVRYLTATLSWDLADRWGGRSVAALAASRGFEALGASERGGADLSRAGGRPDFTRLVLTAERRQEIWGPVALLAGVSAQWAPHQLLSAEEFGVGGAQYGRAYDASEITGDKGFAARVELQVSPGPPPALDLLQFYASLDGGRVYNYETGDRGGVAALLSAAVGLRLAKGGFYLDLQMAKPLNRDAAATGGRKTRPFVSISYRP
ncbi:MAG TPA: ShlB/FhaC/HecB family hemolysin secretion/activation protein [Azospirillaceae bacterium]|nr:ShlB/FhaC/HecB family hemolysin secretion/activation protein [Azospirillaceae bacterium]